MAEPSVSSQERGRRIREILNNPLITRFKLLLVLVFVAILVLYLFISLLVNNKTSLPNQEPNSNLNNERMLNLLERALHSLSTIVLPMPAAVLAQPRSNSLNGTEKT